MSVAHQIMEKLINSSESMKQQVHALSSVNIDFFTHGRFYDDGSYYLFSTAPEVFEFIFENKLQLVTPIEQKFIRPTINYLIPQGGYYKDVLARFGLWYLYDIIKRHQGYFEYHCFATTKKNQDQLVNFYLNENDTLLSFISDFNKKFKERIVDADRNKYVLDPRMQTNFSGLGKNVEQNPIKRKRYYLHENNPSVFLTHRELETASYLMRGYSSKEIAKQNALSPRTIESYIVNIKNKLGCSSKSAIIKLLLSSELSNLLLSTLMQ